VPRALEMSPSVVVSATLSRTPKESTLHSGLGSLVTDTTQPSFERRCIVRSFCIEDRRNLPKTGETAPDVFGWFRNARSIRALPLNV
jgi:hypothetical protein